MTATPHTPTAGTAAGQRTRELAVLGATTVSYYLVDDVVRTPWLRRLVRAGILAAGAAAAFTTGRGRPATTTVTERVTPAATGHGDAGEPTPPSDRHSRQIPDSPRRIAAIGTAGAGALIAGTWISGRVDAVATRTVARIGGRLPLVGRLLRRFPATTWGVLQVGAVVGVDLATREDPAARAKARQAHNTQQAQYKEKT